MTLRELITLSRNRLDDARPPYLWSDDELTQIINERQNELCEKCGILRDATTTAICQISVLNGTSSYTLDNRIIKILSAKLGTTYTLMEPITRDWLDVEYPGWDDDTGTPTKFILDYIGKIRLYPIPTANATLYLSVTRYPLTQLSTSLDTASPEIPWQYHTKLLEGIMSSAYTKDDSETLDFKRSQMHEMAWQRVINDIQQNESNFYYYGQVAAPLYGNI